MLISPDFTEEQRALLGIIDNDGPVWTDHCEHGIGNYVASYTAIHHYSGMEPKVKKYDLFVFDERDRQSVCIRYGNAPEEYISPGSMLDFIQSAVAHRTQSPEYWAAFCILKESGTLRWEVNKELL